MSPEATRILAAIDGSPAASPVLAVAAAVAALLDLTVEAFHVRESADHTAAAVAEHAGVPLRVVDGDPATEILLAAAAPAVGLVVVGSRRDGADGRPTGHITRTTLEQIDKPLVVVPPEAAISGGQQPIRRALFPLEGTTESSEAVVETLHRLTEAGVELVGVHVFTPRSAPAFWDQSMHAEQSWADAFVTRWCAGSDIDLHLRRGAPADTIIEVADAEEVDLIAMGWSQDMSPGHAAVVHAALTRSHLPVLLVPAHPPA